jgi:hypothetical protein
MTTLLERPTTEITTMPHRSYVTEWVIGIVGAVAAGVGAWMYYVPTTWFLGGLAEAWYLGMLTGGTLLLAIAFGLFARSMLREDRVWTTRVTVMTVLAIAAFAGAVAFALIWIL